MDLKQIMQELNFGAQHFTAEEKRFFDGVFSGFNRTGNVAEAHAPHILSLYRKIKFRQLDVNALLSELEASVLLLAEDEQARVAGARMAFDYDGQLDNTSIEAILKVRKAFYDRQHSTLAGRGENALGASKPVAPRPPLLPAHPSNPAVVRRPSARRAGPLGPVAALEAASKLLKGR
jgi:hypothetical protein